MGALCPFSLRDSCRTQGSNPMAAPNTDFSRCSYRVYGICMWSSPVEEGDLEVESDEAVERLVLVPHTGSRSHSGAQHRFSLCT
jgi:hypothetical protein